MPVETGSTPEKLTRREALKRGVMFGGALLWTTPAVQAIGMGQAFAQETSGCRIYCVKFEFDGARWVPLGGGVGNVLTCPPEGEGESIPDGFFDDFEDPVGDLSTGVTIRLPSSCTLYQIAGDESIDIWIDNVAAKCGRTGEAKLGLGPLQEFEIPACGNGRDISHIELIIRCCG